MSVYFTSCQFVSSLWAPPRIPPPPPDYKHRITPALPFALPSSCRNRKCHKSGQSLISRISSFVSILLLYQDCYVGATGSHLSRLLCWCHWITFIKTVMLVPLDHIYRDCYVGATGSHLSRMLCWCHWITTHFVSMCLITIIQHKYQNKFQLLKL